MKQSDAKKIIKEVFSTEFNDNKFQLFISNLLKDFTRVNKNVDNTYVKDSFKSFIEEYKIIGSFEDDKTQKIDLLEVYLKRNKSLDRARTAQRNFVADYLKSRNKVAALVAFISKDKIDWRFSLIKLEHSLEIKNNKVTTKEEITPARRWSFLVGENEGSHTAQSRFVNLIVSNDKPNLEELESAFDIEVVTNEFFEKYKELFLVFKENLDKLISDDENIKNEFISKDIDTVDFAKKTMGQIVFLYFLQKKGWFGVAPNKDWGDGPKNFLRELFERKSKYGDNFFNDVLEPLFYEALAQDRGKSSIYPKLNNCKMPFLNGGLFEPMNEYSWETTNINIPDEIFSNNILTKDGDKGSGILDVFDRYNFTVNENEPLEKEVAVDPEMLGKVFENLLQIRDRKSKGAFYTPREVVHYMCQQALINYLATKSTDIPKIDIENFIHTGDRIIENDSVALKKIRNKEKRGYTYSGKYELLLSDSIIKKAKELDLLLKNIKVADPAVGSGAFPLGMINEIVRARKILNIYLDKNQTDYQFKKHAISNSIHGVDIDPGAVEIAKLRLWLTLIVEETIPSPLPNLDHKIMQGNSLISEYEGIKLFDDSFLENAKALDEKRRSLKQKISNLQSAYFELFGENKLTPIKKQEIENEIKTFQKNLKSLDTNKKTDDKSFLSLFDSQEKIQIALEKSNQLQSKIKEYIFESRRTQKEQLKHEIDDLKWDLIEASFEEQDRHEKIKELKKLRHKNIKPFFVWKLEFNDVFKENGGFDVVIGNPPYIQLQKDNGKLANLFEKNNFETFTRTGDIYCLFYEFGNMILNDKGHLIYITSNKWMRAGYGEKLRNYLIENTQPKLIVDLGAGVFKTATVDTNILLFQKNKSDFSTEACSLKNNLKNEKEELSQYVDANKIKLKKLTKNSWIILNKKEQSIKDKIEQNGTPLKNCGIKIYRGILTGFNDAFIIDDKKKNELISLDGKNSEIIKPLLRGKDISRYTTKPSGLWLINTHNGYKTESSIEIPPINIDDYPYIKKHIDEIERKFQSGELKAKGKGVFNRYDKGTTPYNLRNCAYQEEFEKEKIIYNDITQKLSFSLSKPNEYVNNTVYFINNNENLYFHLAILNTKVIDWYYKNVSAQLGNKAVRMFSIYMENLPIPKISKEMQQPFIDMVKKLLQICNKSEYDKSHPSLEQINIEKRIEQMTFELYGLSNEEFKIIENASS